MFPLRKTILASITFILLCFASANVARADTVIISVNGSFNFQAFVYPQQTLAVGWSQSNTYTNVNISAQLGTWTGPATGTAYLTTRIGPGTTIADQVAVTAFTFPNTLTDFTLFTGLTLTPNTYYLTIANPASGTGTWAGRGGTATLTTDAGVARLGAYVIQNTSIYPPASSYSGTSDLFYTVRGNSVTAAVPEPATMFLLGTGLAGVAAKVRKRRKLTKVDVA